jgi:GNAT superfamily N-acetyltransferase
VLLRSREPRDEAACVDLLSQVNAQDGYPRHLSGSLEAFLLASHETGAWVCEIDGHIAGHVALHAAANDPVLDLAQQTTGLPASDLAVVARLLVSPRRRRQGIGRALLDLATKHALDNGQRAVLDVAAGAPAAALYEQAGWTIAGKTTFHFRDGSSLPVTAWLSPAP